MLKNLRQKLVLLHVALWLVACAETPRKSVMVPFTRNQDVPSFLRDCHARFKQSDREIRRARTHDATFPQVAGFTYLRSSHLLESYAQQAATDPGIFDAWTLEMRDNEAYSRTIELKNLGLEGAELANTLSDLRYCSVWLSNLELEDKPTADRLVHSRIPGDETSRGLIARFVWTRSEIRREAARRQALVRADFAQPVSQLTATGPLVVWQARRNPSTESEGVASSPPSDCAPYEVCLAAPTNPGDTTPPAALDFSKFRHDELGRVALTPEDWESLATRFAPRWVIEQGGPYDKIAAATWSAKGPDVDAAKPVVYYLPAYTRSGKDTLIQFNYFIFFSAHVSPEDPHTDDGHLDGLIWRVTLGPDGRPIAYDAIHASGFDHMWFPLPAVRPRPAQSLDQDLPFMPQPDMPATNFLIRVQSGTHNLRRLIAASEMPPGLAVQSYELRPYEELYELPSGDKVAHNFFNPEGFVDGTAREGRMFYSALGVQRAGMLREWGKHPTSLAAAHYFDDPLLLEKMFELPPPLPPMP